MASQMGLSLSLTSNGCSTCNRLGHPSRASPSNAGSATLARQDNANDEIQAESIAPISCPNRIGAADAAQAEEMIPRQQEHEAAWLVLERVTTAWDTGHLLHISDRGFCGHHGREGIGQGVAPHGIRVVRWKKGNRLRTAEAPSVDNPKATASNNGMGLLPGNLQQDCEHGTERDC